MVRAGDTNGPSRPRALGRGASLAMAALVAATALVAAPVVNPAGLTPATPARAAGTFADPYFREVEVFTGLTKPTSVRFDAAGRAWVTEKAGILKEFDSVTDTTPTVILDISAETMNYWDRGLLSLALDPDFTTGRPYIYLFYVWGAEPGDTTQDWGDACPAAPSGPGSTTDGCVASTKIDRLQMDLGTMTVVNRTNLLWDACQQYPSHSGGGMAFGPDKQLYVALGDGASFNGVDYGQRGGTIPDYVNPYTTVNPCGDPVTVTSPPGVAPTVDAKTAEGGQLRSQDVRTTGDPTDLDGSLIRINPDTGAASSGNPLASSPDANTRRIVAHGFRNPFRMAFRPGTTDLYVGLVGNQVWEAINRIQVPTTGTPTTLPNAGWPCYEGPAIAGYFQALGTDMCASVYAAGASAWSAPFYTYAHPDNLSPSGPCYAPVNGRDGGSPTGLAFYTGAGAAPDYPAAYKGGLFFVDYDRDCLAFFPKDANGIPNASQMQQIAIGIGNPVDLLTGPDGDLYYVDHDNGRVMRIKYLTSPVASFTATPQSAKAPVTVHLDATASSDPDPDASLAFYRWDLDDDGQYDDATGVTHDWQITTPAIYQVGLQVESTNGLKGTIALTVDATNAPPVPVIDTPDELLTWAVGDDIPFSGHATDTDDGTLAASKLSWDLVMLHCPADCHEHVVQTFPGVASGTFEAPDHEYPSHLELRLTATDSDGASVTTAVALYPRTKTLAVTSTPSGIAISVAGANVATPTTATVFEKASVELAAPLTATVGGHRHRFWAWDDSSLRIRDVVATTNLALHATYYPDVADTCSTAATGATKTWLADRAGGNGDEDWFRFSLTSARRVVVTAGDLPVDARLDLYGSCSTRLATSDASGTRFEEITKDLAAGTYRVRVTFHGGASSASPYVVRFQPMAGGLPVKSWRTTAGEGGGGPVRIVGEVLNNTGSTTGRATVTATFRSSSGKVVATIRTLAFAKRLGDGAVTPFVVSGTVPAYASVSFTVTKGTLGPRRSLALKDLTLTFNGNGTVTERGTVRNTGTTTAKAVEVARTWYGSRGTILDRRLATISPSTLGAGKSGTFTILRPVLTGVKASRSALRAS